MLETQTHFRHQTAPVDFDQQVKPVKKIRIFFYVLSLLIFGFAIYYLSEIKHGISSLKKINSYWVLIALCLQLLTYLFAALIYRLLLPGNKKYQMLTLKELYKVSIISQFFNQTIPSAQISGNAFVFNYFQWRKLPSSLSLSVIFTELLSFYSAMEFIVIIFLLAAIVQGVPFLFHSILIGGLLVYLLFGCAVLLSSGKKAMNWVSKIMVRYKLFRSFLKVVQSDLKKGEIKISFKHDLVSTFLPAICFQLLLFIADVFTIKALFYGLGTNVSIFAISLSLTSAKIVSLLPISPGALILYESGMAAFFVALGIPLTQSVLITLAFRLLSFWLPIPAGLIFYRRWLKRKDDA